MFISRTRVRVCLYPISHKRVWEVGITQREQHIEEQHIVGTHQLTQVFFVIGGLLYSPFLWSKMSYIEQDGCACLSYRSTFVFTFFFLLFFSLLVLP